MDEVGRWARNIHDRYGAGVHAALAPWLAPGTQPDQLAARSRRPATAIDEAWEQVRDPGPGALCANGDQIPPPAEYRAPQERFYYFEDIDRATLQRETRPIRSWNDDTQLQRAVRASDPRDLCSRGELLKLADDNGQAIAELARTTRDAGEFRAIRRKSQGDSEARLQLALRTVEPEFHDRADLRAELFAEAGPHDPVLIGLARTVRSDREFREIVRRAAPFSLALVELVPAARNFAQLREIQLKTPPHARAYQLAELRIVTLDRNGWPAR